MQVPGGQGLQYFFSDGNQNIEVQGDIGDSDIEYFEDDDELDREGNPLPSPEEIVAIINSIPSYRYEEAKFEEDLEKSMIMSSRSKADHNDPRPQSSMTERKRRIEQKKIEKQITCSICLDMLKTGV